MSASVLVVLSMRFLRLTRRYISTAQILPLYLSLLYSQNPVHALKKGLALLLPNHQKPKPTLHYNLSPAHTLAIPVTPMI